MGEIIKKKEILLIKWINSDYRIIKMKGKQITNYLVNDIKLFVFKHTIS